MALISLFCGFGRRVGGNACRREVCSLPRMDGQVLDVGTSL